MFTMMTMNNVILSMTYHNAGASTTTSSSEAAAAARGGVGGVRAVFLMKTLRMLLLMLMVLSAPYIQPSLAESETNDLNTLEPQNATAAPLPTPQKPLPLDKLELRQYPNAAQYVPPQGAMPPQSTFAGCPLCDSSVYSYCSHKLIHDSCCCDFPGSIYQKPPECVYYECSLLYAKSCYEHSLIKNCCCNNPY